ncbi:MAG: tRNA (N(6)-L-threonylcarbamoyladenosine(37)-C(2))-methylthiotransferase MtaB [Candidatus Omnitrophota bacterium]
MNKPTFIIKTLGCKVNQYEEQVLRESLIRLGFRESGDSPADIGIVNSCTVTSKADGKTRKLVHRLKKENPSIKIFVTGCCAVFDEDIKMLKSMHDVYQVIANKEKMKLPHVIDSAYGGSESCTAVEEKVSGFYSHTRAFLKIQDGCDQTCSYCKVNLVRGPSRSKEKAKVIEEFLRLIESGYKEIVLTGICLGSWKGADGEDLSDLLKEIDKLDGDFRIRLSSIEPDHIDDHLIGSIASSKRVCRHLHIPLQSGSDKILKNMNRRYTSGQFKDLINRLRSKMPLIGITMDVISGFPGESDDDFFQTLSFVREVKPSRLHVFGYSDRKGTGAFEMKDKVPSVKIKERVEQLIETGEKLQGEFCRKFVGKEVEVLVEKRSRDLILAGYTGEYVKVRFFGFSGKEGAIIKAKASEIDRDSPCLLVLQKSTKSSSNTLTSVV